MPSIFTHPAVPAAIAMVLGERRVPKSLWQAGMVASVIPDFDCAAFWFGIPYESQFGHRGFMHSFVFAAAFAALWAWRNQEFLKDGVGPSRLFIWIFIFICTASHPMLDAMTDGGEGIALLWPFTAERFFFPWQEIPVSPIGRSFFSARGLEVFSKELMIVWLPCLVIGVLGFGIRKLLSKKKEKVS